MQTRMTDPHGVIPVGYKVNHSYEVLGFCDPSGTEVMNLMVEIRYESGGETTLDYITVLRDYMLRVGPQALRDSQRAYRTKKVQDYEKALNQEDVAKFRIANQGYTIDELAMKIQKEK